MHNMPSDLRLSISPQDGVDTHETQYNENNQDSAMPQAQPFEYDLGPCDIDWDFPMNWLPYNNGIETNYLSILGIDNNIASTGSLPPSCGNAPVMDRAASNMPILGNTPQTVSTVASTSQGNGAAASPQLSMSSDRTIPGDLYATSSNGARRPCTDRSRHLFPPLGVQGCSKLCSVSEDSTLRSQSNRWEFPDLDNISIQDAEGFRESAISEATYANIYDSFENTCLESGIFKSEFTSSEFPPLAILDYCIKLFFEHFSPIFPLVHPNTTDINANWVLTLALLDRMGCYFFDDHHAATFDVQDIKLPHDGLWSQTCSLDWSKLYRRVEDNPSLSSAVNTIFRDRTAKVDLGEFSRILLLHAVYQEYSSVNTYFKRPLSSWMPQNNPERQTEDINLLNSDSNWRNAALDCVDTLHWAANATIASLLGAEHPTVLHLHFSRVVLLVPRTMLMTLANYLKAPEGEKKMASNQQKALQAEREISEWAQQDVSKARLAALHCGCFLWHIRRYSKMASYEPPCVFWATLTLWAYSVYSSKPTRSSGQERSGSITRNASPDHSKTYSDDDSPTFIRLDRPNDDEMVQLFVRTGVLKAYISGVGDIYASDAPARVLKEGRKILESVSLAWGRSTEYMDLLRALG
ncbi:hypothetical protein FGRMN_5024 [Fusarium graminum]|nr:hypothetical protein FGRMN_5024 [Fusarium graminum]